MKNHSPGLHVPLRGLLRPNLVTVAPLRLLNWVLHPTKCDAHPGESICKHWDKAEEIACALLIPFRLGLVQGVIVPLFRHKFLMCAVLCNASVLKDQDPVYQTCYAQTVGDQKACFVPGDPGKVLVKPGLGEGIKGGGGLIQDQDVCAIPVHCPQKGNFLPLASGKIIALLAEMSQHFVKTFRLLQDHVLHMDLPCHVQYPAVGKAAGRIGNGDIIPQACLIMGEVLKDDGKFLTEQ